MPLPEFARPEFTDFLSTIPLAIVAALGAQAIMHLGRQSERVLSPRPFVALPIAGLAIAGLTILFSELTDHSQSFVLFSGEEELPHLITDAGTFTVGALLAMIACKGVAYSLSLGGFRGGPAFGALFIGAAAGVVASRLPGFELTPAVAVGMAATFVSVLGLPLSSVVLATLLVSKAGYGAEPLIILAVIVSHIVTLLVGDRPKTATA